MHHLYGHVAWPRPALLICAVKKEHEIYLQLDVAHSYSVSYV